MKVKIIPYQRGIDGLMSMKILIPKKKIIQELKIIPIQAFQIMPRPTKESLDFLFFSVYISVIDRLIKREWFADNWSRNIEVEIPVSSPLKWEKAKNEFEKALSFLSGDNWTLSFIDVKQEYFWVDKLPLEQNDIRFKNICLFSGGLDSLIGAINLAEQTDNIILSSFYDGHGAILGKQDVLYQHIKESKNIFLNQFALNRIKSNEDTTRARSVLFLGLATYSAINLNIPKIITPENGLISINLPLTSSRAGANSTRTMHPYFIKSFQNALVLLGHNIKIDNPYIYKTKGEMLIECKNKQLLNTLLKVSMSCSHPTVKQQWKRRDVHHCGYCMPCIIRRASIHRYDKLLDQGNDYGIDIFNKDEMRLEQDGVIPRNIKAMLYFLFIKHNNQMYKKLLSQIVRVDNQDAIISMLINGYDEIRLLIEAKGSDKMKKIANI